MLYIPCPHCGLRNENEFHYGAEAGVAYPEPNAMSDAEWARYLHIRANP
jgi:sarcosine oxidase subunit delta